ncbi:hypothetical protein MN608_02983 [Microdochium nivale]|nr:hypothetical protein MN608_02983 [Microdochium nivale]
MFNKAIIAATLATAVSAGIPALNARQDLSALGPQCQAVIGQVLPLYQQLPTPPAALITALPTNPCAAPSLTGSASAEYASYTGAVMEWYGANSAALLGALSQCPQLASFAAQVPVCTSGLVAPSGAPSAAPYPTASATHAPSVPAGTGVATPKPTASSTGTGGPVPTAAAVSQQGGVLAAAFAAGAAVIGAIAL